MKKETSLTTLIATAILLLAAGPASAKWVHFGDSIFEAPAGETVKHPSRLRRIIALPTDATGTTVEVCIGYVSTIEKNDRGKVSGTVTITDPDDNVSTVALGGAVSRGTFGECKAVGEMPAGTIVEFDVRFKKFPRMRDSERFQVGAAIAIDGANPFARQATPLSVADQEAIAEMSAWARGGQGVALRREGSGWTVDWRIGADRFELVQTFGTIDAAIQEWCKRVQCE